MEEESKPNGRWVDGKWRVYDTAILTRGNTQFEPAYPLGRKPYVPVPTNTPIQSFANAGANERQHLIDERTIMYGNRNGRIRIWAFKHGADAESFDDCFLTDAEMSVRNSTRDSETNSDMPPLTAPEEVDRLAGDHKASAKEGLPKENILGRCPAIITWVAKRQSDRAHRLGRRIRRLCR